MKANVKCSSCGAEITNLNFSWPKKQFLFIIPFLIISFIPLARIYWPSGDFREDLKISLLSKGADKKEVFIKGIIENSGSTEWKSISFECEFFNGNDFLDQKISRLSSDMRPNDKEHFKLVLPKDKANLIEEGVDIKLKISTARKSVF